jgi:hypothetical protein
LHNTDDDPFLFTIDDFAIAPGQKDAVAERLEALEGVQPPLPDDEEPEFTLLKPGNRMYPSWENTVVGRAVLSAGALKLESNSIARADELRRCVEDACRGLLRHRAREHSDPLALASQRLPGTKAEPIESAEVERLLREYKERHYATWVDHPLPALGGKTPRQAARTKAGREEVDLLLRDMENHEAGAPGGSYDFAKLRHSLGDHLAYRQACGRRASRAPSVPAKAKGGGRAGATRLPRLRRRGTLDAGGTHRPANG